MKLVTALDCDSTGCGISVSMPDMKSHLILTACLLVTVSLYAQAATRTWTSTDGRKIEAAFVSLAGDNVKIRLANGNTADVPLSRLSAEDQAFAKAQSTAPAAKTAGKSEPVASKVWPRTVSLEEKPEVVTVREDDEKKEFVYRSPHYEFVCDSKLGANVVREFGRMFEATWLINCQLPLDLKPKPEKLREIFLARLFTNKADYMDAGAIEGLSARKASTSLSILQGKMVLPPASEQAHC